VCARAENRGIWHFSTLFSASKNAVSNFYFVLSITIESGLFFSSSFNLLILNILRDMWSMQAR